MVYSCGERGGRPSILKWRADPVPVTGRKDTAPTERTPGSDPTCSNKRSKKPNRTFLSEYAIGEPTIFAARMWSVEKPGETLHNRSKLLNRRPAPTNSNMAKAISETTNAARVRKTARTAPPRLLS